MDGIVEWKPSEIQSMSKLAKRVTMLQADIPTRDSGLPLGYIDSIELVKLSSSDDPSLAIVPLSYMEGFPTVDGTPFWERLDNEPLDDYRLFKTYRNMVAANGVRSIATIAQRAGTSTKAVEAIAKLWHWTLRARAYDLYKERERQAIRDYEIKQMENTHAKAADRIFEKCMNFLDKHHGELTPKSALDWLKLSVELKRLSLGLPKDKPEGAESGTHGTTININQHLSSNQPSIQTKDEEKTRMMEILAVLKQTGALTDQIVDVESEVVEDGDDSRSAEASEAGHDTPHDEVHQGVSDSEAGCISTAG